MSIGKPGRGDKIEIRANDGPWITAWHNGDARTPGEFWTRTEAGPGMPRRYSGEGRTWRWPAQSNSTEDAGE